MNLKRTLSDRVTRTLVLSIAFFLSGLAFFGFRMLDEGEAEEPSYSIATRGMEPSEAARPVPSLAGYPPPEVFHQFEYVRGQELRVNGECRDKYYVVMIFHESVDYRVNPMDARYNTAFPCPGGAFSERIPIDTLFLEEGERYYVIKAEQGTKGPWYDPY
jgi:hypothetical protein